MKCILVFLMFSLSVFASTREEVFFAKASKENQLQYTEKHTAVFDAQDKIVSAKTEYYDPSGKLVAKLDSNFAKSITAPDHTFEDYRFKHSHGIKNLENDVELFSKDDGKEMQRKKIAIDKSKDQLVVGCQGLAYYFRDYLDVVKQKKRIPIQFLIPGKLDYYDFELQYISENAKGEVNLEIEIKNWFLKFFAPKLYIKYDKNTKRFISYKGLSNLYDPKGEQLVVDIVYDYSSVKK